MNPGDETGGRHPTIEEYSSADLRALPRDTRVIFAENAHENYISLGVGARPRRHSMPPKKWEAVVSSLDSLRCGHSHDSAFSVYPTTEHAVKFNKFVWEAVHNSCFAASEAADLLGKNVYCMSLPEGLYNFLATVSWMDFEETIFYVLATLAADEENGMDILDRELAPSFLMKFKSFQRTGCKSKPPAAFHGIMDHVFNFIFSLGAWAIPISLAFISAQDMGALEQGLVPVDLAKRKGSDSKRSNKIMYKLFRDFQVYERFLKPRFSRVEILDAMARVIAGRNHSHAWSAVDEIIRMTQKPNRDEMRCPQNLLTTLPEDLVLNYVVPSLIVQYASDVPSTVPHRLSQEHQTAENMSMEDVDECLDAEERNNEKVEDMDVDEATDGAVGSSVSPSPWSLKFLLLEHRTLLRHYYGAPQTLQEINEPLEGAASSENQDEHTLGESYHGNTRLRGPASPHQRRRGSTEFDNAGVEVNYR